MSEIPRCEPIFIRQPQQRNRPLNLGSSRSGISLRHRHDSITVMKDSLSGPLRCGIQSSPQLSSPTPPTFVPDGSHQASRIGDYLLVEQVEGCNSGNVFRAVNTNTELEFICKVYKQEETRKAVEAYMRIEPHPNINHVVDVIHGLLSTYVFFQPGVPLEPSSKNNDEAKNSCFKADNLHNLTRSRKRLSEEAAADLFVQIARAVDHCHESNIVLRDLKLRKFIFRDVNKTQVMLESLEDAYIIDSEDEGGLAVKRGCPAYISPETLASSAAALSTSGQASSTVNRFHAKSSNMWSVGVMLYTMLVGRYPFEESQLPVLFSRISRGRFVVPGSLSSEARDLLHNLLQRDPAQRFRASDVLEHPWLRKHGRCWDSPRFVMTIGCGGDVQCPREAGSNVFHDVPSAWNIPPYNASHYEDQIIPGAYFSDEDDTMFELAR